MKPWLLPSGRQRGLPFILPEDWTPQQALAVFELLDDLRELIWVHYQIPIQDLLREQYQPLSPADASATRTSDPPF
jgi:hypothetical protein